MSTTDNDSKQKALPDARISEELALFRFGIKTLRDHINASLDGMLDEINRLLPPEDSRRSNKYKNFSKKDWEDFLGFDQ